MMRILTALLVCLTTAALAGAWRFETVDDRADSSNGTSISLDSEDCPHIAYLDESDSTGVLRYARRDSGQWHIELIDDQYDCTGHDNSIALNSLDRPCISYGYTTAWGGVRYAEWNGVTWNIDELSSGFSHDDTSLALDTLDNPHVAFSHVALNYDYWDGASWQLQWFDDTECDDVSIDLDSYDRPHITYHHLYAPNDRLKYTHWNGSIWTEYTLDDGGRFNSLALDSTDTMHVAYYKNEHLYYIYDIDSIELVDYTGNVGREADLALDSLDRPHICYFDYDNKTVKYAHWDGSQWHVETVAPTEGSWYGHASIAVDSNDLPHISFRGIDGYLMYAWYDPEGEVEIGDLNAGAADGGVLVNWRFEGETPAGVRVLRSAGEDEPVAIHENQLPGTATSYLDRLDKGLKPLASGIEYRYWLEVIETDGRITRFGPTEAITVPSDKFALVLDAAYPSPARDFVSFAYSLPADGRVVLSVYDLSGRRVATLVDADQAAGRHEVSWSCTDIPSGVYLYRLETSAGSLTQRLIVAR
jgi:hypothetical protein